MISKVQIEKLGQLAMQARLLAEALSEKERHLTVGATVECVKAMLLADDLEILDWELRRDRLW